MVRGAEAVKLISKRLAFYREQADNEDRRLMILVNNDPEYSNDDTDSEAEEDPGPHKLFHHIVRITGKASDRVAIKDMFKYFKAFGYMRTKKELHNWIFRHINVRCVVLSGNSYVMCGVTLANPLNSQFDDV